MEAEDPYSVQSVINDLVASASTETPHEAPASLSTLQPIGEKRVFCDDVPRHDEIREGDEETSSDQDSDLEISSLDSEEVTPRKSKTESARKSTATFDVPKSHRRSRAARRDKRVQASRSRPSTTKSTQEVPQGRYEVCDVLDHRQSRKKREFLLQFEDGSSE